MKEKAIPIIVPHYQKDIVLVPDLVDSIRTYFKIPFKIIFIDDFSQDGAYEKLLQLEKTSSDIKVLRCPRNYGWGYGMWVIVGLGLKWAHENLDFPYAIRIDCDGLIIKRGMDSILDKVYSNPKAGIAGHLQAQNNHFWFWHLRIARKWKNLAKKNGYFKRQDTENCFWFPQEGLMTFSHNLIKTIIENKQFEEKNNFYKKLLGSRGLFDGPFWAVLCYAYGFEAVELPIIRSYFGIEPLLKVPFESFREMGICAIHPLKRSDNPNAPEVRVREYFNQIRKKEKP